MEVEAVAFVSLPLPFSLSGRPPVQRRKWRTQIVLHRTPRMQSVSTNPKQALSSERAANLPWTKSISSDNCPLFFMPFVEHQLSVMSELDGLRDLPFDESLSYQKSAKRSARIESWAWQSTDFKKIRATYIDAGYGAQVFNSVWYPRPEYEHPLLGIDFLSFGKKKVLCVMDFQPLSQQQEYIDKYCGRLEGIKQQYEGLSGSMSDRFYDEAQFFSRQLVFAKFENQDPIQPQLLPAFKQYLETYVTMIKEAEPNNDRAAVSRVIEQQREYDQYSAERDPAIGLFRTYWGEEWAERFTHEFLFSDSEPIPKE